MNLYETDGFYGSGHTPCTVLVCENRDGSKWYAVEGSQIANCTFDPVESGVNVEELSDHDCFTWSSDIDNLDDLETAVCS